MFAIGALSDRTGVKIPTIRYYEDKGLLPPPERTAGNQRRYSQAGLDQLHFIKHARDLGFSLAAIKALISLQSQPGGDCARANAIAETQLLQVQAKIARLQNLAGELARIAQSCSENGCVGDCNVLNALADHSLCTTKH